MSSLIMSPIFWIGVALVIVAVIVLSALIGSKRNKEVEELGTYFPEEEIDHTNRISVEKVRRSTLARQQRKHASQHLPRRQPREDILEIEKQEFVSVEKEDDSSSWDLVEPEEQEENLNLPTIQESANTERQYNRRQYKSSILSKNDEPMEENQSPAVNRRPSFTRRTPSNTNSSSIPSSNMNTTPSTTRSPLRRPVGNKTAYPSLRRETTTTEENTSPRFPNRRTKRMF